MRIQRRDRMKIYGDLLRVLLDESSKEKITISKIMTKSNLPFTRLKKYVADLVELGLIEDETSLKPTEKGKQYLNQYETILAFMESMGLGYK
jgi:predicted transcriptional regulator